MIHQIVGWAAVGIGSLIVFATLSSRHSRKESLTSLPIGLCVVIVGLWQLDVIPLGEILSSFTGVGQR